ncbi:hypothetical protein TWF730_004453 [Orbilia blumenaviensis]|uniref:Uncharacterized protein n=1 Tax=Orbilia blumenaviensis TaxID=1796055 RepID=A0AAV9TYH5_9PEZI
MVCDINLPTITYHTFKPPTTAQRQRRAHRVRILMLRGVEESVANRLGKKRGSAWQPLTSRWIECRESEHRQELLDREIRLEDEREA